MNSIHQFECWLKKGFFIPFAFTLLLLNGLVFSWNSHFISFFTTERNNKAIIDSLIQQKALLQKKLIEVCNTEIPPKDKQTEPDPMPSNTDEAIPKDIKKQASN